VKSEGKSFLKVVVYFGLKKEEEKDAHKKKTRKE